MKRNPPLPLRIGDDSLSLKLMAENPMLFMMLIKDHKNSTINYVNTNDLMNEMDTEGWNISTYRLDFQSKDDLLESKYININHDTKILIYAEMEGRSGLNYNESSGYKLYNNDTGSLVAHVERKGANSKLRNSSEIITQEKTLVIPKGMYKIELFRSVSELTACVRGWIYIPPD